MGRVRAQVGQLVGVVVQVEQLRREGREADVFPAVGAKHVAACVIGIDAQGRAHGVEGEVDLGKRRAPPVVGHRTMQDGLQRPTFQPVTGRGRAHRVKEGGHQVDGFHQRVADGATGGVGLGPGIADDQRHPDRAVVEQLFLAKPVVAQVIAVVRSEDDHRLVPLAGFLQPVEEPAQVVVDLTGQPHVGGDDGFAHMVLRKRLADIQVHEGAVYRVRRRALGLGPDGGAARPRGRTWRCREPGQYTASAA